MSEKEKKAIDNIDKRLTIEKYTKNIATPVYISDLETILNLIQSQQEEIEKKDKIIDLQINFLYELGTDRPGTVFKKLWDEGLNAEECGNCRDDNKKCVECIKQYFEKKVEEKQCYLIKK